MLHSQRWPAESKPRGTALIVHGLGEHIGRYAHVAAALNVTGWHVVGHDERCHGRSEGESGRIVRDLALVVDATRTVLPGPLLLLDHSMRGLVAARFVAEGTAPQPADGWRPADALVLSSPALALHMNAAKAPTSVTLAHRCGACPRCCCAPTPTDTWPRPATRPSRQRAGRRGRCARIPGAVLRDLQRAPAGRGSSAHGHVAV